MCLRAAMRVFASLALSPARAPPVVRSLVLARVCTQRMISQSARNTADTTPCLTLPQRHASLSHLALPPRYLSLLVCFPLVCVAAAPGPLLPSATTAADFLGDPADEDLEVACIWKVRISLSLSLSLSRSLSLSLSLCLSISPFIKHIQGSYSACALFEKQNKIFIYIVLIKQIHLSVIHTHIICHTHTGTPTARTPYDGTTCYCWCR